MKRSLLLLTVAVFASGSLLIYIKWRGPQAEPIARQRSEREALLQIELLNIQQTEQLQTMQENRLKDKAQKAQKALSYAKSNNYDLKHVILIDFSIHPGKKRFFVWNYQTDSVEPASLVAHGYGNEHFRSSDAEIVFSNIEGSYASSLGKYRVGIRSHSQWGIHVHYKLHGLEKSNDNAYWRTIVLHAFERIPKNELYPLHLPLGYSQGCPVIDNQTMTQIDALMKTKSKPVLLWIYR